MMKENILKFKEYIKQFGVLPTINSNLSFGSKPSKIEIQTVITTAGFNLPNDNISFIIEDDDGKCWFITYILSSDTYFYEKLTKAR